MAAPMLNGMKFAAAEQLEESGLYRRQYANFEAMMEANTSDVLIYPENVPGIAEASTANTSYALLKLNCENVIKHKTASFQLPPSTQVYQPTLL